MTQTNKDIRRAMAFHSIRVWQIAQELGVHPETVSRRLRKELSPEDKAQYFNVIDRLVMKGVGEP